MDRIAFTGKEHVPGDSEQERFRCCGSGVDVVVVPASPEALLHVIPVGRERDLIGGLKGRRGFHRMKKEPAPLKMLRYS